MTDEEKRKQVVKQCQVVSYMAKIIAQIHDDYAEMFATGGIDILVEQVGQSTAYIMEKMGNILNNMDAVDEKDAWTNPVFEVAHKLWPQND